MTFELEQSERKTIEITQANSELMQKVVFEQSKRLEAEERAIYEKYKVASQVSRRFVLKDTTQARTATL